MYVPSNSPKYICHACRNKIPADDLEAVYLEQLKGFFLSRHEVTAHLSKANDALSGKEELVNVKRRELAKLQAEIDRVYRLYVEEKLTPDEFAGFFKPLQERKKALEDEIPRAEADLDYQKITSLSADEILSEAHDLYARWPSLTPEEKRSIVESITEKIVVGKGSEGTISIDFAYLPPSAEETGTKATPLQGFMAATSMTEQGSVTLPALREIETSPSSSGWRRTSSAERLNSGSSSRKSTP